MRNYFQISDLTRDEVYNIFATADRIKAGEYKNALSGKCAVLFFPSSSLRTRLTFEKGVALLGGQSILFPQETLEKREELEDVAGYLENWADVIIIRYGDIRLIERLAGFCKVPLINAMTSENHPCEILSDMYALSKLRPDFCQRKFLYCGVNGNVGKSWLAASRLMGFDLVQCCPEGYELDGIKAYHNIYDAIHGRDIVCTDSLPSSFKGDFSNCRVSRAALELADPEVLLNPCPPFFRGEEVTEVAIKSEAFVGYGFKNSLLEVQQSLILFCMGLN